MTLKNGLQAQRVGYHEDKLPACTPASFTVSPFAPRMLNIQIIPQNTNSNGEPPKTKSESQLDQMRVRAGQSVVLNSAKLLQH